MASSKPAMPLSPTSQNRQLADRDCSRTDGAMRPERNPNRRSHARLPRKAGSFVNRVPRTNSSSSKSLPRGRSFQGSKPLTPHAQAAQDGYFHRKAAKMYAERKKAAMAAAATSGNGESNAQPTQQTASGDGQKKQVDVINVTVDNYGVKIENGNSSWTARPMSRRNSRSRISRSNSRQLVDRGDDKENMNLRNEHTDAAIEAYFAKKRSDDKRNSVRESDPWDGSMPQRKNSRSLIETNREKQQRRERAQKQEQQSAVDNAQSEITTAITTTSTTSNDDDNVMGKAALTEDDKGEQLSSSRPTETGGDDSKKVESRDKVKRQDEVEKGECASISEVSSESESNSNSTSPQKLTGHTSGPEHATVRDSGSSSGKWCNECAGVGLQIAELLSQLQKQRGASDGSCESSSKKSSWKSMVLGGGDSKSKSAVEKGRLQQEITVLRATVDFLYSKIERMEKAGMNCPTG